MHSIDLHCAPPRGTVVVDGDLGLGAAYDLRRVIETALCRGCRRISVDLSRVVAVDGAAVTAFLAGVAFAETQGAEITVAALSRPAARVTALAALTGCRDREIA